MLRGNGSRRAHGFCLPDPRVVADTSHPLVRLKEWQLKENERDTPHRWHSQFGQDRYVHALLGAKRGGFFVDLAANAPVHTSNTRALERDYGWAGAVVGSDGHLHHVCLANG